MMHKMFLSLAFAVFTVFAGATGAWAEAAAKQGVVVQVSDNIEANWHQALNVVRNLQAHYGKDKVDVELVVFGNGADLLKFDSPLANRIDDALNNGTKVVMCENSMRARKLTPTDMHGRIGFVKAGVVELIDRQKQGWSVLHP